MPTTIEASRSWEVSPRKSWPRPRPGQRATRREASTTRIPRVCPVGSAAHALDHRRRLRDAFVLGIVIMAATPGFERLPPGGRAIPYLGSPGLGFVGVGAYAAAAAGQPHRRADDARRPRRRAHGPAAVRRAGAVRDRRGAGGHRDRVGARAPAARVPVRAARGRAARTSSAIGYAAGALQLPLVLVTDCDGDSCPGATRCWSRDNASIAALITVSRRCSRMVAVVGTPWSLLAALAGGRARHSGAAGAVLLLGAAILVLGLGTALTQAPGRGQKPVQIAFFAAFALLPAAFLSGLVRTRFFRTATVARLIERLAGDPRDVRGALADALGDPTLRSPTGCPARLRRPRGAARSSRRGRARDRDRPRGPARRRARCTPQCWPRRPSSSSRPRRRGAGARERAAGGRAARAPGGAARVAGAAGQGGDAERRRLGRDLHDGAQQRLVALMIELQLARERITPIRRRAGAGRHRVRQRAGTVSELRDLAAGIHPAVLAQRGLDAAFEALASRVDGAGRAGRRLDERLPGAGRDRGLLRRRRGADQRGQVRAARRTRAWRSRREDGLRVIEVRDDGVGGANAAGGQRAARARETASARSTARSRSRRPAARARSSGRGFPSDELQRRQDARNGPRRRPPRRA